MAEVDWGSWRVRKPWPFPGRRRLVRAIVAWLAFLMVTAWGGAQAPSGQAPASQVPVSSPTAVQGQSSARRAGANSGGAGDCGAGCGWAVGFEPVGDRAERDQDSGESRAGDWRDCGGAGGFDSGVYDFRWRSSGCAGSERSGVAGESIPWAPGAGEGYRDD